MPEIQQVGIHPQTVSAREEALPQTAVEGKYRGEKVVSGQHDVLSMIQNNAEESGAFLQETVSKKIAERKAQSRERADQKALELAAQFLEKLPDLGGAEKLKQFADSVRKQGSISPQDLKRQLQQNFSDITHQHAALSYLEELLEQTGGKPGLRDTVQSVKAELEQRHGPEIRAGYNIAEQAARFEEQGLGSAQQFRDDYRTSVLQGFGDLQQAYDHILKQYGPDQFSAATEHLIKALGHDLDAPQPSRDSRLLKAMVDDLYLVQVCRNTHLAFDGLINKMSQQFQLPKKTDALSLMKEVLPLKDQKWINVEKVLQLPTALGARNDEQKIYCLRELHGLVRGLPEKIYASAEDRDRLVDAFKSAMFKAVDQETV